MENTVKLTQTSTSTKQAGIDNVKSIIDEIRKMEHDEQLVEQFSSPKMSICETFDR
ncbi:hypothetical protein [Lactiplantibacillus pentosus]|uniref:hypothetical protein n=1 Tax=Lactiplantibacillus pentosus TaxID=1589 RepID=UPI0021A75F05|nr:hypothetical protein [Lactiplantibacillus pentosus]WFC03553.1 hypothetical protein PGN10_00965 [Lactiplantibacillus pentosus]